MICSSSLLELLKEKTQNGDYDVAIIHANAEKKAAELYEALKLSGYQQPLSIVSFGSVIATHLGEGAVAFGITPKV